MYEYVVDVGADGGNLWQMMKRTVATKAAGNLSNRDRNLLLGGRRDGYIAVYNWETGDVDFEVEVRRFPTFIKRDNSLVVLL